MALVYFSRSLYYIVRYFMEQKTMTTTTTTLAKRLETHFFLLLQWYFNKLRATKTDRGKKMFIKYQKNKKARKE